tara:strand:- start:1486 stop:2328 length:843 start_codon:yes stop_codon:yes gene_type:complete
MMHPAEMALHQYMEDAAQGKTKMSEATINKVADDIKSAMQRQFSGGNKRDEFRLRMSNVGRPTCQLWFEKNHPEKALPKPTTFIMNMMLGDIVEAVFKALLTEAGVTYEDNSKVTLKLEDDEITGEYDLVIDDAVDDVKSASDWSYRNKFASYDTLAQGDSFGYVSQLAGYARAADKKAGGWWVVNKANGEFKYVKADINLDEEITKIQHTVDTLNENEFKRCFEPVPEKWRGKETGNTVLNDNCRFCSYKYACFPTLEEKPAKFSQAKEPKTVAYVTQQ